VSTYIDNYIGSTAGQKRKVCILKPKTGYAPLTMPTMNIKKIDKTIPIPVYHQLKEIIRDNIKSGKWSPGTRIPSEPELGKLNHISQMTARHAITELCVEGVLYRIKGKGTFVARGHLDRDLSRLTYFPKRIGKKGSEITTVTLHSEIATAPKEIAQALEIAEQDSVIVLNRLRNLDNVPFYIETSYTPHTVCPEFVYSDSSAHSLHTILEKTYGFVIDHATVSIEAISATKDQGTLLALKEGTPLLRMSQTAYLKDGRPIQYLEAISRSDKFKYTLVRRKRG
jgi:GntR family transcriptional regulator